MKDIPIDLLMQALEKYSGIGCTTIEDSSGQSTATETLARLERGDWER